MTNLKTQAIWLPISFLIPLGSQATVFAANDLMAKIQASGSDATTLLQQVWLVPSGKNLKGRQIMLVKNVTVGSVCEKVGVKKGDFIAMGTPESADRPSSKSMEIYNKLKSTTSEDR